MKTGFTGYLCGQRTYHNYITTLFLVHRNGRNKQNRFCVSNTIMQKEFPGAVPDVPFRLSHIEYGVIYSSWLLEAMANAAGKILLHPESHKRMYAQIPNFKLGFWTYIQISDVYVSAFTPKFFKTRFKLQTDEEGYSWCTKESFVVHLSYDDNKKHWTAAFALASED